MQSYIRYFVLCFTSMLVKLPSSSGGYNKINVFKKGHKNINK